jgi:hypothetical protein
MGTGSFFSATPSSAFASGEKGRIIPAYLSLKNPKSYNYDQFESFNKDKLVKEGYDGVVVKGVNGTISMAVAFEPTQIKSAIGNIGTYSPETGNILAGNHTFQAATALGWDKIAVTYVDCDDEQALRILLADNRANDLASYDDNALAELLTELAEGAGLDGTLFEPEDLQTLLNDLANDDFNPNPSGDPVDFSETFEVVITCVNEYEQTMLLEKLSLEGLKVRAIVV